MGSPTIAALFVERNGPYWNLDGVDAWDKERDARLYAGPWPVVAHPPCQLWVNFAALNYKRWGGEHNRPGNDGGCFESALASVRRWCGVLEHPAGSKAWATFRLPTPGGIGWQRSIEWIDGEAHEAYVCEVWQSAYGHRARKRTWLYYVGFRPGEMRWNTHPGDAQVGWFDRIKPTLSKREASATPPAFRDALLELSRHSTPTAAQPLLHEAGRA